MDAQSATCSSPVANRAHILLTGYRELCYNVSAKMQGEHPANISTSTRLALHGKAGLLC